jgi:uncharacterized protein YacL
MWLVLFRVLVVAILSVAGYVHTPFFANRWAGLALGAAAAGAIIVLELKIRTVSGPNMVGTLVGGVTGLFGARLVLGAMDGLSFMGDQFVHAALVIFLVYIGMVIGAVKGEWFEPARIIAAFQDSSRLHQYKILDTSVIIDARIADICETGS